MRPERFDFEGVEAGYIRAGQGQPLLLLHGSGPGASSIGNWKMVLEPLSRQYEVFAMDLIGFGTSGRKPAPPYFDYGLWVRQAEAMLARIPGDKVGVIGHSLSASLALTVASRQKRVAAVLTTGAMGADFELTDETRRTWSCPRDRDALKLALKGLIHDTSFIDDAYLEARENVIFAEGYADYFDEMFGGDQNKYIQAAKLSDATLANVKQPVLMLHGREDRGFPASVSETLANHLPQADLVMLSACSHSVAVERTSTFLALASDFFGRHLTKE